MGLRDVQTALYKSQRAIGDYRAAQRGVKPLAKRLVRRAVTRRAFGILRRGGWF